MTHNTRQGSRARGVYMIVKGHQASAAPPSSRRAVTCTSKRYQLFECIGAGRMATVHRALEHGGDGSQRIVALKRLLPDLGEDQDFIRSFIREAELAAHLDHPNIARIYTLGRGATGYFISMELIDGQDLASVFELARRVAGPPPVGVVTSLLAELCDALSYAHRRTDGEGKPLGLVHRDLSLPNLIVDRAGHLKIIDFGISKAISRRQGTLKGLLEGKFAYMAPEVIDGSAVDARADIFSVGVVAHELLTARPLFAGDNDFQTVKRIQRGQVAAPSAHNRCCPSELDAIVLKALARDPGDRWQSMAEMSAALAPVAASFAPRNGADDVAEWLGLARSIEGSQPEINIVVDDLSSGEAGCDDDDALAGICPGQDSANLLAEVGGGDGAANGRSVDAAPSMEASGAGWRRKLLLATAVVFMVLVAVLLGPRLYSASATAVGVAEQSELAPLEVIGLVDVETSR